MSPASTPAATWFQGDRNVTVAIGHGYKAAYGIDCYLKGQEPVDHPKKEIATFESLNTWYYSDAPKTVRPMLDLGSSPSTFDRSSARLN